LNGRQLQLAFYCRKSNNPFLEVIFMRSAHPGRLRSVILACLLFSSIPAQDESRKARPTAAADEVALRALAEGFYSSQAKKDLDGFLQLWSAKAPELAVRRIAMQKFFADHEKIEVKGLLIRNMTVEGEKAKLRIELEMNAIQVKTGKPAADLGKMIRALEGVKEDGTWKIWREAPAEEDLAAALVSLKTEVERSALLTAEKELVTERLVREMIRQGVSQHSRGNFSEALARFRQAQDLAEQIGDRAGMSDATLKVGVIYYIQGNQAQALEHFQKSLALSEALGDKPKMIMALGSIGDFHSLQGNYAQALEYIQKCLALSEALGDKAKMSMVLGSIANIQVAEGDYTQALENYRKSLALSEASADKIGVSRTMDNIGIVHRLQGDYAKALEYYQKSLVLSEASDKIGIGRVLRNIGNVHYAQGNYAQALEYYQKGLMQSEALGDKVGLSVTLNNMGNVHCDQGNYTQALEYYQKSLAMSEALGYKVVVSLAQDNMGNVHYDQGNYTQALEYYQKELMQSEALGNKVGVSTALKHIGNVYARQGHHAQALEQYQKSLALSEAIGDNEMVSGSLIEVGRTYRALNQLTPARQAFEKAIATIETLRTQVAGGEQDQQRFFEKRIDPYQVMVELLVTANQFSAALAHAERAKARVLLDVLNSGRVSISKAMTSTEQERERRFNNQLVSLNTQISRENLRPQPDPARLNDLKAQLQKARLEYEAFQTGLYAAHPELKARRGDVETLTSEQARSLLPDTRSVLVEYVVTDERTYLFTLTGNAAETTTELKVYPLEIKRQELNNRVARFREAVANGSPAFRRRARDLYDLLLKPAAAQLEGRTSLIIVPDGVLWELPFQALQPDPNRYLIEDCAIAYAPSLTALREMIKQRDGKKASAGSPTLLAFGNPALGTQTVTRVKSVLMDEKLDPLPEAERQVNVMRQIYGTAKSKVYIGAEANEERAKAEAGGYRILHLATHGILNNSSPMYSHLLLAQTESETDKVGEDGLLEAWEIMKLDLNADLTVLSACETARGRVGAGEGMIGLSWALFVAGCPTSVVSQWKVDSASTTELMLEFHRKLKSQMANRGGSFSAARALREAALKLRRTGKYRHPFYWAGFVVAGKGF
jgi:CHAT domain-containing protein/Tfp pilus assembly protein PilF